MHDRGRPADEEEERQGTELALLKEQDREGEGHGEEWGAVLFGLLEPGAESVMEVGADHPYVLSRGGGATMEGGCNSVSALKEGREAVGCGRVMLSWSEDAGVCSGRRG